LLFELPELHAELDLEVLSHYMSLRYLPGESTLFRGVRKLPRAHALICEAGRAPILEQLWCPSYEPKFEFSERELLDRLDVTLAEVVEQHMISEVPIGCFLSGGIDSSLIVAYAARALQRPVRTFSIGVHEDAQNELPWARQVAERYRTDHFETIVEPDLARLAPRMVAALEEPVDPFGAGVYVVSEVAARHVTVALGGDGGDELFAGYDRYLGQYYADLYCRIPGVLRRGLLRPLLRAVPDSFGYNSFAARLRWLDRVSEFEGPARFAESSAFLRFGHERKARLFSTECWRDLERQRSECLLDGYFSDGSALHALDCMLHADLATRIADNDLPTTDRLSMAHSLELRSPLLDRRVAELAMRAPAHWKLKRGRLKYLTRKLAERYLPRPLIDRPKQGFGFPLARWLAGPLRPLMQQVVDQSSFAEAGIFRRAALQELLDRHASGAEDHCYRLWMVFQLELFWRHFLEQRPVSEIEGWVDEGLGGRVAA
jgi:asparagine synthase (glutamine-hydrolysing)